MLTNHGANPTTRPPESAKAFIAAYIEQARAFAEKAIADPSLIETTVKANRAKVGSGAAKEVYGHAVFAQNVMAEQLYQIQEDLGLEAALRAANILAGLPSFTKAVVLK